MLRNLNITDKVGDETAIAKPSSGVLEERFTIRPKICLEIGCSVDVVIVSWIEKGITKNEEGGMFVVLMMAKAACRRDKTGKEKQDGKLKAA